jgi:glycosyltransferase involved in cell wall biosynthesis
MDDVVLHLFCAWREKRSADHERLVARAERTPWIRLCTDFLTDEGVVMALSRCDVNVWSHHPHANIISSSGSIRQLLAAGRPVVATDNPMIDDVRHLLSVVPFGDSERLADALRNAPRNDPRIAEYVAAHDWDRAEPAYPACVGEAFHPHLHVGCASRPHDGKLTHPSEEPI